MVKNYDTSAVKYLFYSQDGEKYHDTGKLKRHVDVVAILYFLPNSLLFIVCSFLSCRLAPTYWCIGVYSYIPLTQCVCILLATTVTYSMILLL